MTNSQPSDKTTMIFFNKFKRITDIIVSPKLMYYLMLISLFPLLLLSFFNNPGSDDFWYAYESQLEPFWSVQIRRYHDWSGRYFSNGLLSLDPLYFNDFFGFKILPILLFGLFVFSVFAFVASLQLDLNKCEKLGLSSAIVISYLFLMPDLCEGFYWMPGAITNQLPVSLALFYFTSLIHYYRAKKIKYVLAALVLLPMIMGCNEIIVIIMLLIHCLLNVLFYVQEKKISWLLLLLLLLTCGLAAFEVLAPGNSVRGSHFTVKNLLVHSILKSIQLSFYYITLWIPLLTLICFFLFNTIKEKIAAIPSRFFLHPLLVLGLLLLIVFMGIFPGLWSTNGPPPGRTINTSVFFFIVTFFYFFVSLVHYFSARVHFEINPSTKVVLGILIIFNFISHNNVTIAYKDLLSLKAYKYDKELKARFHFLENTKNEDCVVEPLENKPTTIYNAVDMGLTNDKDNWKNQELMDFYQKKSIVIRVKDSTITE
ncbi:DUF6056 family protein [Flavobacterium sp. GCM10027622]|uniref:DUF6056 family protein n=1 Tax=unclassified Flavobacterium TaxID=196869 RepID=UPI0036137187